MASSARGLNPLLLELQAVLPQALKRCGGAAAGDGSQAEQQPTPGSDDDVLLGRLRTVLFSLLQSCIGSKLVKQRETMSVLRVTAVLAERVPLVFSSGAQGGALLKLLRLLADAGAHASPPLMAQLLQALAALSRLLARWDEPLLLELHAGLVDLCMDLEQVLFGLSLLPASRPAAHELPVCAALCEALLSQRPEGAGGADEPMADAASARDAVGAGGAAVPVAALAGVGEWQALALAAVRLLSEQLAASPLLLGPRTPGALAGALGRFLACGSPELQEASLDLMALTVRARPGDAPVAAAALHHALWLLAAAADGLLPPPGAAAPRWRGALAGAVGAAAECLAGAGLMACEGGHALDTLLRAAAWSGASGDAPSQAEWLRLAAGVAAAAPDLGPRLAAALPLLPAGLEAAALLAACWREALSAMCGPEHAAALLQQVSALEPALAAALSPSQAADAAAAHAQQARGAGAGGGDDSAAGGAPQQGPRGKKRRKLKQAQLEFGDDGLIMSQRAGGGGGGGAQHPLLAQHPLAAQEQQQHHLAPHGGAPGPAALRPGGTRGGAGSGGGGVPGAVQGPLPAAAAAARVIAALQAPLAAAAADADARALALQGAAAVAGAAAAAAAELCPSIVAFAGLQAARYAKRATERTQPLGGAELDALLALTEAALRAAVASAAARPAGTAAIKHAWQGAGETMQALITLCTPARDGSAPAPPGARAAPAALRVALAWRAAAKLLGLAGVPPVAASCQAADVLLAAACGPPPGGRAGSPRGGAGADARAAAVCCLPLWCFLQHAAWDPAHQRLALAPASGAAAAATQAFTSAAGQVARAGAGEAPALEALARGAGAFASVCQVGAAAAAAAWLSASLEAAAHPELGGMPLEELAAAFETTDDAAVTGCGDDGVGVAGGGSGGGAGLALPQAWPLLEPLTQHADPRVASAALWALGAAARAAPLAAPAPAPRGGAAARGAAAGAGMAEVLARAVVGKLRSDDPAVRAAALAALPALLRVPHEPDAVPAGGAAARADADGADADGADADGADAVAADAAAHPAVRLVVGALSDARRRLSDGGAAGAAARVSEMEARAALLRGAAALARALAGRADEAPLLVALVDSYSDEDPQVMSVSGELLHHRAASSGQALADLLLRGPCSARVLRHVGLSLGSRKLLQDVAALLNMPERELAAAAVPHVIGPSCQRRDRTVLQLLAAHLETPLVSLLTDHAGDAFAHMFWFAPEEFGAFVAFVDEVAAPHDFLGIVRVCGRLIARPVVRLSGLPQFWPRAGAGRHGLPPELLQRAHSYLAVVSDALRAGAAAQGAAADAGGAAGGAGGGGSEAGWGGDDGVPALLQGPAVALLLKEFGGRLGGGSGGGGVSAGGGGGSAAADRMQCLRALMVLIELLGDRLSSHALQIMAVLSEALEHSPPGEPQLQALAAWLLLVRGLAARAPQLLERVAAQAAVVLLPVLVDASARGPAGNEAIALAAEVLEEMVVRQRALVRRALQAMPPLPEAPALAEVNRVLAQEHQSSGPAGKLALLVRALRHESPGVRHAALGALRSFMLRSKRFVRALAASAAPGARPVVGARGAAAGGGSAAGGNGGAAGGGEEDGGGPELLGDLMGALMACCDNVPPGLAVQMRQRCAECLGLLGAVDPGRLPPSLQPAGADHRLLHSPRDFLVTLVTRHLVRILETSTDTGQLEVACYAIQHLLQHYTPARLAAAGRLAPPPGAPAPAPPAATGTGASGAAGSSEEAAAPGGLYSCLPEDVQPIVAPYLTTRFTMAPPQPSADPLQASVFGSHPHSFRRWLHLWLKRLCRQCRGPLAPAFAGLRGAIGYDAPLMLFVLPYVVLDAAAQGGQPAQLVGMEMAAVAQRAAGAPPPGPGAAASAAGGPRPPSGPRSRGASAEPGAAPGAPAGGAAASAGAGGAPGVPSEVEVYCQVVFTLYDALSHWVAEKTDEHEAAVDAAAAAAAAAAGGGGTRGGGGGGAAAGGAAELPADVAAAAGVLAAVPRKVLALAALRCGALARALQYFETHARAVHGGGLNPASANPCVSYGHGDVAFLLEVYGQLEEPDGLEGLVHLRQGGLTASDQMLSAEKAGAWSEALALYEQALAQEEVAANSGAAPAGGIGAAAAAAIAARQALAGGAAAAELRPGGGGWQARGGAGDVFGPEGLRALRQGHLRALLQAGRLQTLLGLVDGLLSRCAPALPIHIGGHSLPAPAAPGASAAAAAAAAAAATLGSAAAPPPPPGALAAACQLAALGVAAAWRLGAWQLLRSYLSVLHSLEAAARAGGAVGSFARDAAAGPGPGAAAGSGGGGGARLAASLEAAEKWEVAVGGLLEAMQRGAADEVGRALAEARFSVLSVLPAVAAESYARAYPLAAKLHALTEAEEAFALMTKEPRPGPLDRRNALQWSERLALTQPNLGTREPLLALRRQLAGLLGDADEAGRCWLQQAKLCRSMGHHDGAEAAGLQALAAGVPGALLERCRLLWACDKGHRAIRELEAPVRRLQAEAGDSDGDERMAEAGGGGRGAVPEDARGKAQLVLQLAQWMQALGQGGRDEIMPLFEDALRLDPGWEAAQFAYGSFLDSLYAESKARAAAKAAAAARSGGGAGGARERENDRTGGKIRIKLAEECYLDYLPMALQAYGESIRHGHSHVMQSMPRLLTLFFEFGSDLRAGGGKPSSTAERNAHTQVVAIMRGLLRAIPPHKWLLVLPQLTSRVCHPQADVAELVTSLLTTLLQAAPHQLLWAMAGVAKSNARNRADAANALIAAAKRQAPDSGRRLIDAFNALHAHLVKLCPWQPQGSRQNARQASAKREFPRLVGMLPVEVQVPVQALFIAPLPPPGGKLSGFGGGAGGGAPVLVPSTPSIAGLQDEVLLMSSLQRPKKITFLGSDGALYPFLAKPKDDLRKDYRLMDFAGVLNALMARDPEARRRSISLRTYAVIPLADDCGILQWVDNLVAFKSACEEVYTAEKLYNRRQTPTAIRKLYDSFHGTRKADLLAQVLTTLPPRMHKWLLSRFPEPGAWLAARLGFTRTAAAWSMVGHVLGMGDRHGENIMIDAQSGDIMHVDFGCLFDRGLTLEVPEMVPFRLTQNVADGCGVSGVEGGFRRAAEITLQVLRTNKGALMTSAETFLADPLVEWTKQHRGAGTELDNPMAKDALATIEGRLSGTLLGVASIPTSQALSVEGQVARLISEAVDHENLGRMYIWWMPWF